jgi:hypothetical protein
MNAMRAGIRIAAFAALGGFAFVSLGHLHLVGNTSPVPAVGAVLWLLSCLSIARANPPGQARRLVVMTLAVAAALLTASIVGLLVNNTLYPDVLASLAFLAILQCFAATIAELAYDLHETELERAWETTGRLLVVVDVASVLLALAWAANVVERRSYGRFRLTEVGLAPVGTSGRLCLAVFTIVAAVGGAHFVLSAWRTWSWARRTDETAPIAS